MVFLLDSALLMAHLGHLQVFKAVFKFLSTFLFGFFGDGHVFCLMVEGPDNFQLMLKWIVGIKQQMLVCVCEFPLDFCF